MSVKTALVGGVMLIGSLVVPGCDKSPYDVCKIYMPDREPEIYHWHYRNFSSNGQTYFGGYHCRVYPQGGQPAITFCVGEQNGGDTDFLDGCGYIH